jgi:4-amino-4-deoxy-L-arabinose transferase-like glycosyltransferase
MAGQRWSVLWPEDRARRFLHVLLLLYLFKQILTAIIMPPFTGHDEVAHFQYIRIVAEHHRLPKLVDLERWREERTSSDSTVAGDFLDDDLYPYYPYVLNWFHWQPSAPGYRASLTNPIHAVTFPDYHVENYNDPKNWGTWPDGLVYTANHPPLYYIVATPVYWATEWMTLENQMIALRMVAIPFGLLAVLATFLMARWLFPRSGFVAIVAATFVAFQTQMSYEAAMINNDILVIGFGALLMALLVRGMRDRFPWLQTVLIGVVFGMLLLSKGSALVFAAPVALMMIASLGLRNIREWLPKGVAAAAVGFGLAGPWYIFLHRTYGNFSGLKQIADLQYNATYNQGLDKPSVWDLVWNKGFAVMRWNETWGEFGWRKIPLDQTMLWVTGIPLAILLVAFLAYLVRRLLPHRRHGEAGTIDAPYSWQMWALVAFLITGILGYAAVIQFGLTFSLTQARYFFPMVPPVAVLLAVGLHTIVPARGRVYAQVSFVGVMIALNLFIYSAYVVPYWYARIDLITPLSR